MGGKGSGGRPDRERRAEVERLYYGEGLTAKEVGLRLDPPVSKQAVLKMLAKIGRPRRHPEDESMRVRAARAKDPQTRRYYRRVKAGLCMGPGCDNDPRPYVRCAACREARNRGRRKGV